MACKWNEMNEPSAKRNFIQNQLGSLTKFHHSVALPVEFQMWERVQHWLRNPTGPVGCGRGLCGLGFLTIDVISSQQTGIK